VRADDPEARIPLWGEPDMVSGRTSRSEELWMRSNSGSSAPIPFLSCIFRQFDAAKTLHFCRHNASLLPRIHLHRKEEAHYAAVAPDQGFIGSLSF